jgi:hypothetical protein
VDIVLEMPSASFKTNCPRVALSPCSIYKKGHLEFGVLLSAAGASIYGHV